MAATLRRGTCRNLAIALTRWLGSTVEFAILGPVEARGNGAALPLGGPKQRALLAILLLNANEPVSRDRLIAGL
jgi:hypothetical protein